jgi:diguanylate cyclase (GGDEF)-like protein/PAS domain S-box-containing protein
MQQSLPLASADRSVEELHASEREMNALDAELAAIALRAAERGFALSTAGMSVRDLDSYRMEAINLSADQDRVLDRVARRARRLSGADGVVVEAADSTGSLRRATSGTAALPDHVWRSGGAGTLRVCADTESDPRVDREVCRRLGIRSLVSIPVRRRNLRVGTVAAASSRAGAFDERRLAQLKILGRRAATSLVRLHIIEAMRRSDLEHVTALVNRESLFRRLFYENPQPMWVLDAETRRFLAVNDAAIARYGYSAEEFAAQSADALRPDTERFHADFARAMRETATIRAKHRLRDGRIIDVEITAGPQEFNGRPAMLSIINDVTERNRLYKQLRDGAFHDTLTGGANRTLFTERVAHALTRMRRRSATIAVLVADIDHFKHVNDSMGHASGDALLQAAAARIQATLRPGDTVARLSADEFAILLEEVGHPEGAVEAAERLAEAFADPLDFADGSLVMTLSIGVATSASSQATAEELLGDAELAMYAAKAGGRGRVTLFEPGMQATAAERLSLEQDLRHAVDRGELRLFYQPLVVAQSGEIVGCEALVRWQHPLRGLVAPDSFIPLAEETGMISAIDTWVLRTACNQAAAWHRAGHRDLFVAVNVSGRELGRSDLVDRVEAAVFESGLSPAYLEIEITESTAAVQSAEALEELRQLRRAGITVAIDDFGTGYSSLSKLSTFPVDRLKIDRSFLTMIRRESDDEPLVAAMIGMAHRLGLEVTAEGVETEVQRGFLRRNGCDLLQGFLFSRPVPAEGFDELLGGTPQQAGTA